MGARNFNRLIARKELTWSVCIFLLAGCSSDYSSIPGKTVDPKTAEVAAQVEEAKSAPGTVIPLHYQNFFSLVNPNEYSCAGDVKTYYKLPQVSSSTALTPFAANILDSSMTIKPAFIKNVAVDLSDSNSPNNNNAAYSCSFGNGTHVPPNSNCATFDFGSVGANSTSLNGSILLLGGIKNYNYAVESSGQAPTLSCGPFVSTDSMSDGDNNLNVCPSDMYSLAIETLPASSATDPPNSLAPGLTSATQPISNWSKVSSENGYSGPEGAVGASVAFDPSGKKILLFGGASPLEGLGSTGLGANNSDTWIYDVATQTWEKQPSVSYTPDEVSTMPDCTSGSCDSPINISKSPSGRAYNGYVAAPGFSMSTMSTDGIVLDANKDWTDRIISVGGFIGDDSEGDPLYSRYSFKFNPTFGPERVDIQHEAGLNQYVTQWLDSNPSQLVNDSTNGILTLNDAGTKDALNFGAAFAYNTAGKNPGYVITMGGFDPSTASILVADITDDGNIIYSGRKGAVENQTGNFSALPTFSTNDIFTDSPDKGVNNKYPIDWTRITEAGGNLIRNFGGVSLLPGFNATNNEFIYFGGINCRDYLQTNAGNNCPRSSSESDVVATYNNTSQYISLGASMPANLAGAGVVTTPAGTHPQRAGMAAARGLDASGDTIIVAWGGVSDQGAAGQRVGYATSNSIFYLYDNAGTHTWVEVAEGSISGSKPTPAADASLVFSHVTRKFYLFGGKVTNGTAVNSKDSWELTVAGTDGTCSFTWKKLNIDNGITCYPDCTEGPTARHGHRMVEVNYNNTDPTAIDPACGTGAPCSFGIFMEGGTVNGDTTFGDRWMFDPTANGGRGHWQRVDTFPPRNLAAMTDVSYFVPSKNKTVHRAVMFGGQTGLHSPDQVASDKYFVPPTLGDTHMYDFETGEWTRVRLLGKGVNADAGYDPYDSASEPSDEFDKRQIYRANADAGTTTKYHSSLTELAPPALAGAIMVTRTFPQATLNATSTVEPLKIPEIYMMGGRLKDGSFNPLSNVYKFCSGSTGEDTVNLDATCDAYDEDNNPNSPSPKYETVGRWLSKNPPTVTVDPTTLYSFLGAAAYDPGHDKIVMYGGLKPDGANTYVTQTKTIGNLIYEYTPATVSLTAKTAPTETTDKIYHGYWTEISTCSDSPTPTARYGHTMAYDSLNGQLIVVGGYDIDGTPLTQDWLRSGYDSGYHIPEIWKAKRSSTPTGSPCYNWTNLTTFGNELDTSAPDMPTYGLAHAAGIFIPGTSYNTGYYMTYDASCGDAGPIASNDSSVNKLLAGGMYIDIDRSALGPNEDLLLNLTYFPLGPANHRPDNQLYSAAEEAVFKIHLINTGMTEANLRHIFQPRYLTFADTEEYPKTVDTLSILAQPTGSIRQEQILVPISTDSGIDRIRIERYSGSAILIDIAIYRMGYR